MFFMFVQGLFINRSYVERLAFWRSMRMLGKSMRVGELVLAALLSAIPSARGWQCASGPHFRKSPCGPRMKRAEGRLKRGAIIMSSSADSIDVDELWPSLTGKQTSANEAAGKVIRDTWAADLKQSGLGQTDHWHIRREMIEYKDGQTTLQGLSARPEGEGLPTRLPGVILAHTAVGPQEDFILWKLDVIARLGYAAFALDLFGTGRALWDRAESLAARRPITEDRSLLQARANAAVQTLRQLDGVDPDRIAAVGYCFGGMAVLDLARASPAIPGLKAVASLHGILAPMLVGAGRDARAENAAVGPRVVVLHASGDPFVPPKQVQAMEEEFARRRSNLEVVRYGGTALHAFTRPEKTGTGDRDAGLSYDADADADSWRRVVDMLRDELGT